MLGLLAVEVRQSRYTRQVVGVPNLFATQFGKLTWFEKIASYRFHVHLDSLFGGSTESCKRDLDTVGRFSQAFRLEAKLITAPTVFEKQNHEF